MTTPHEPHQEIATLVHRYADAVVRRDEAQWAECWASAGRWVLGPGRAVEGRDAVVELWRTAMGGFEAVVQHVHNGVVEVDDEGVVGRWYIKEHFRRTNGEPGILLAYYDDTYVFEDHGWRFASRTLVPQYHGPADLSGTFLPPR